MSDAITSFFEAWAIEDAGKRDAQVDAALSDTIFYADPRTPAALDNRAAVKEYVGMFSQMAPGMAVSVANISTTLEFKRATVLFGTLPQAQTGQYIVETDTAGKITRLIGFVGLGAPE